MNLPRNLPNPYEGWRSLVQQYQNADTRKAVWQIVNSYGGLFLTWALMLLSLRVGYWLTLLLSIPAAGFVVRIFIIQHDCGHASFFSSSKANDIVGSICGYFTLVPYKYWRKSHAIHHANHAKLEDRGVGDIWTMTVEEYQQSPWGKRALYRLFRNPLFLFGIAPTLNFVVLGRIPKRFKPGPEHNSVWLTNIVLFAAVFGIGKLIGFKEVAMIQIPITVIASSTGTWLFYVQHQFEHTYWEHTPGWNYTLAAMEGSSYYKLPIILQWFTGNIGFHHIHHLSPRIPNYFLPKCHSENPLFQRVAVLTVKTSLQTGRLALWCEERRRLVGFGDVLKSPQPTT